MWTGPAKFVLSVNQTVLPLAVDWLLVKSANLAKLSFCTGTVKSPFTTTLETEALSQLRANVESRDVTADGLVFGQVYLDNCQMSASGRSWAGVLASLDAKGLYRPQGDGCFGDVRLNETPKVEVV